VKAGFIDDFSNIFGNTSEEKLVAGGEKVPEGLKYVQFD
jgi:hypothetical protein